MLSQRIYELRKSKGLSQAELGGKLNFTQQTIAKWEKGVAEPNTESIIRLANFYGVTADYLLGLTDIQSTDDNLPSEKEQQEKLSIAEKLLVDNYRKSSDEGKKAILGEASFAALNSNENSLKDLELSSELTPSKA
ncbi:MAG: helix-turn-helix domain-containing protein [Defluviitaleaceae bacterium]|nr:helix-turn-helix domain-containing protein [Defluviitaleaceae bacterium]